MYRLLRVQMEWQFKSRVDRRKSDRKKDNIYSIWRYNWVIFTWENILMMWAFVWNMLFSIYFVSEAF